MRHLKIIFLASGILLIISAGLYFFAPDFRDEVLVRSYRKVPIKKLKTLEGREEIIRGKIKANLNQSGAFKNQDLNQDEIYKAFQKKLEVTIGSINEECSKVNDGLDEYPDIADSESDFFKNRSKAQSILNDKLGQAFNTFRGMSPSIENLYFDLIFLDNQKTNIENFENLLDMYDQILTACPITQNIGTVVMSLAEVSENLNPRYGPFFINASTNLALGLLSVKTYGALFQGAGILRNMNIKEIYSGEEVFDIEVLSERIEKTNANFEFELKNAKTVKEKQEVLKYYQEEALVLGELLKEFTYKIQATYSDYSIQR